MIVSKFNLNSNYNDIISSNNFDNYSGSFSNRNGNICFYLSGTGSYLRRLGNLTNLNLNTFYIALFVKLNTVISNQTSDVAFLCDKRNSSESWLYTTFSLYFYKPTQKLFLNKTNSTNTAWLIDLSVGATIFNDLNWHFVEGWWDGNTAVIAVDLQTLGTQTVSGAGYIGVNSDYLVVNRSGLNYGFNMTVDEIVIANFPYSLEDRKRIMLGLQPLGR